jgi:hypothetical protein
VGLFFGVEGGGLPMMEVDRGASDDGRLVFVRGPRRSCGVTLGLLGMAPLIAAVVIAARGGSPRERLALLALGGFVAVCGAVVGVVLATNRSRFIVDRKTGQMTSSWWFLGIENRTSKAMGVPVSVSWSREVVQSGGGSSGLQERITYPVQLHHRVGDRMLLQRLFVTSREEESRRLALELGAYLGVEVTDQQGSRVDLASGSG